MKSKKIIYGIITIIIIIGVIAINILIPAPNPTNNDTTEEDNTTQEEEKTKGTLYKYNIEDFDYSNISTQIYSITVTTVGGGTGKALINLYPEDNSCFYQISISDERGSNVSNSTNCSYSIEGNILTITTDFQNIYNPSTYYSSMGYTSNISYEYNHITTAEILENWKGIIIDTQTYRNAAYRCALQRGLEKILFNPENKSAYQLNGNNICHTDGVNEELSIDVSEYKIIDKTNKKETNNKKNSSNKETTNKDLIQNISFNEFKNIMNDSNYNLVLLSQKECTYCTSFKKKFNKVLKDNNLFAYDLDLTTMNTDELNELLEILQNVNTDIVGTPTLIIVIDGTVTDIREGDIPEDEIISFLKDNNFID